MATVKLPNRLYVDRMTFSGALTELKRGYRVQRSGWNGKGMWIVLIPANNWKCDFCVQGSQLPWIAMSTVDGKMVPWLASQTDILAEDWQYVD